ncbi:adenosylcobinamide-phosphate synthase CbiB [Comamonas endophytica]|uniref:Cobalamin biosynthesis protein CobD n=2 Tax=Comamonas endophytica TaxID=2949090 RepID=A0ABY6G9G0_9BURK|nr:MULTISPECIES: adenosylcobinamide-phosphate synthase CbiB [unclassified Acidovorax]MCD2513969.1 adenosylcobinamide-phosphate synthase CbiB [Acidovorax sp. D4N7]UYG51691.1 adenosylcobinamide-phosphate synthase CbiB [Acidovorax sp. 5MLIR]UYG52039.1 adenosylcobinamide-phosphate synthase CbiB [Acidovorax sp. 5MLIR]
MWAEGVGGAGAAAAAMLLALLIDRLWGEPPARMHPVVGMGRLLGAGGRWAGASEARDPDFRRWAIGAALWCLLAAGIAGSCAAMQWLLGQAPVWLAVPLLALLLKPLFAWRMLQAEVQAVEAALQQSLEAGRERLSWLVSRDVTQLSESEVRESALETLAENLNDSVVAPLFWFALLGLPGAALYRFANTADAMWGYPGWRGGRYWQWGGKWAAHADDLLSWIPARLTALLLALGAGGLPLAKLWCESRRTPSPNGGWPMAALALALDVRLGKPGSYVLHAAARPPEARHTQSALQLTRRAVHLLAALTALGGLWSAYG